MNLSYFSAEELIKQRLRDTVTLILDRNILSASDIQGVKSLTQSVPAIHISPYDDDVLTGDTGQSGSGSAQSINQQWLLTVAVRNVRSTSGEFRRDEAGEIVNEMLQSLQGYKLSDQHGNLKRRRAPVRTTYIDGFAYFPFLFETKLTIVGSVGQY